ncbi:MAG: XRE family transcriptional regulator [Acidobacteria bacterium]|nr:MAG: XRE family transcriptional regulator [Acidobacteriota bacterium]PYS13832.1 MAG: XRE family transcriptional regulator [Acidobacteriota bacterium]
MDISQLIQQKLSEFGMDQRDLADAADVTESYISQLLNRKKAPPAPERTDIYDKLGRLLKLPAGKLAGLADIQRKHELKKKIQNPPLPLFKDVRALVLQKCKRERRREVSAIFEKEPFGELERLVTQKLMDVVKALVKKELERENWLRILARESNRSYKQMRVAVLEFLDADVFNITPESCIAFLDPLIMSWDIDLSSFSLEIVLNRRIAPESSKKFEFVEKQVGRGSSDEEPGFREFLKDDFLSGHATPEEIDFLQHLRFKNSRRPTPLYYYRELQNLRDPLHFRRK